MTLLDLTTRFTGDELLAACSSLGVRRPLGLAESMARHPSAGTQRVAGGLGPVPVSDNTAAALAALADPEAIAVVERVVAGRNRITYVATRGPWGAVHRIHGEHHVVEAVDAERATDELLEAAGLAPPSGGQSKHFDLAGAEHHVTVDVTRGSFDRMAELVATDDLARAGAALEAEGVAAGIATAVTRAAQHGTVHVLGLRCLGIRYAGCELSWVGDGPRWLVPLQTRSATTGAGRDQASPRHLRVQLDAVTDAELLDELSILFC